MFTPHSTKQTHWRYSNAPQICFIRIFFDQSGAASRIRKHEINTTQAYNTSQQNYFTYWHRTVRTYKHRCVIIGCILLLVIFKIFCWRELCHWI